MNNHTSPGQDAAEPSDAELLNICQTISGLPANGDEVVTRLQFIADLLADAGTLPSEKVLVWREPDRSVKHVCLGEHIVVGRKPPEPSLSIPDDKLLSRCHFSIRVVKESCLLEDLKSRNGTSINEPNRNFQERVLHDGDLIFAGNYIFAFFDQSKVG